MSKNKRTRSSRYAKHPRKEHEPHHGLPEICVLVITAISEDGELIGEPLKWDPKRKAPHIVVTETGRGQAAVKGDRVLAKLRKIRPQLYQALVIRVLPTEQEKPVIGVFAVTSEGGIIEPISRKNKESYMVAHGDTAGAQHGELVSGVTLPGVPSMSMDFAKITERLGKLDAPKAASLIAANMHNLPSVFSKDVLAEAEQAEPPVMSEERVDLRHLPLVTIDGEDARDFDDAVFAAAEEGGWHLVVAIADVAHYVQEDSALDQEALERGNSVYFPDRVIPMLPERLSNGLCSLMPNVDRYCLAAHIWIDGSGHLKRYHFVRGLMRSQARLTYNEVQTAYDTNHAHPQYELIKNLYAAYAALAHERDHRGALDLNLPEYKILFDQLGNVAAIAPRERLEAHRLIETFMIAANVAAADHLLKKKMPAIYRVHEPPSEEKLHDLQEFLKLSGYSLHVGAGIKAAHFNRVLKASEDQPNQVVVHTSVLRSQMQAYYSHENLGHFGLALTEYCHFTSPIRRYADLVVHRSLGKLISEEAGHHKGKKISVGRLPEISLHISETERRAMMAERDASDRYKVSFMAKHIGNVLSGTIVSLNEYGLFVALSDNGIQGFVPVRGLPGDFYLYDKRHSCFKGQRTKQIFAMGQQLAVRVREANAITGSLIFEIPQGEHAPERPHRPFHKQHKGKPHRGDKHDKHKKSHKQKQGKRR